MYRPLTLIALGLCLAFLLGPRGTGADEFTEEDLQRWQEHFDDVREEGRRLWTSDELGTNGVVCAQCHPNAADTHPETYPKFQKQLGRVVDQWEMVNWCIANTVEGERLEPGDPKMIALLAYMNWERRGVAMEPGKH